MSATTRADWEHVPADPDLARDLGYDLLNLDVLEPDVSTNELMILPQEEDMLREDAFIVAATEDVCDPLDWV